MPRKTTPPLKGRPVSGANGNQTWQWESQDEVDTGLVRTLGEGLTLDESSAAKSLNGSNPYDQTVSPSNAPAKGRTLDDMRALSEKIKRSKRWAPES